MCSAHPQKDTEVYECYVDRLEDCRHLSCLRYDGPGQMHFYTLSVQHIRAHRCELCSAVAKKLQHSLVSTSA